MTLHKIHIYTYYYSRKYFGEILYENIIIYSIHILYHIDIWGIATRLTIIGLSPHWSTFLQMYSGSVRLTGLTDPNGDSRIFDEEQEASPVLNVRTAATHRPCGQDDDDDEGHGV